MIKSVRWLGFLLLLFCPASGQELQFSFHHLGQDDGLSPAEDYFIFQDSEGFIWISTAGGLNRYIVRYAASDN